MAFDFIYGDDEYLTAQAAKEKWKNLSEGLDPELGTEIVDGACQKVDDVETMAKRFKEGCQTVGLFGGARAVWLKNVNFITDTVVGRAEGTLNILEELKPLLEHANSEEVRILISASPVDRRLSFFKWLSTKGTSKQIASLEGLDAEGLIKLAQAKHLVFDEEAADIFVRKVGSDARMVENELEKLSTYLNASAGSPQKVSQELVLELTSAVAAGEFFEPIEAFYSRKPDWALEATQRYFAMQKDASARPIIAAFFNRNRLLMLLKAALEEGLCKAGFKGITWTPKADALKVKMGAEKTPFNLFAQNPWYLGNLARETAKWSLEELQNIQRELISVFEKIHSQNEELVLEGFIAKFSKG